MATRRSTRARKPVVFDTPDDDSEVEEESPAPRRKGRTSVQKSMPSTVKSKPNLRGRNSKVKVTIVEDSTDDEDEFVAATTEDDTDDEDVGSREYRARTPSIKNKGLLRRPSAAFKSKKRKHKGRKEKVNVIKTPQPQRSSSSKTDFTNSATAFISSKSNTNPSSFWSRPKRVTLDPFESLVENVLDQVQPNLEEYLPSLKESVTFKTISESSEPNNNKKSKYKGSVFRKLSWFEGKLADSQSQEGNLVFNAGGPVLGLSWHPNGKLLAISTSSYPSEDIDYKVRIERKSCIQIYRHYHKKGVGRVNTQNYLTPQLFLCTGHGYATHLQWGNFWPDCWESYDHDESTFFLDNKYSRIGYLACSFEDGIIRIFSLRISDLFMVGTFSPDDTSTIPMYTKSAEISLRIDPSVYPNAGQVCKFEWHEDNKLLVAAYCSGIVAVFDVQTTSALLVETVKEDSQQTTILMPFWCFQAHLGPINGLSFDPMSPRYFVTGSKDRNLKLWDLHLRQEIECRKIGLIHDICWIRGWINVAVAVDAAISNLSSQYNFVRFYQLGTSQPRPNCAEFMDISSLSFHEGLTLQGTESGSITCTYFDNFWRDLDYDRNKKKHNVVNICKIDVDSTSFKELTNSDFSGVTGPWEKFQFKDEAPRVVLTFLKERVKTILPDPKPQFFENYIRFLPYLRINKVSWCPTGGCFAAGYRSGLLTIVPATFSSLYG